MNQSLNISASTENFEDYLLLGSKGNFSNLTKCGIIDKNSEIYKTKCINSTFYPFGIALAKGRIELIATSYKTFKNWIIGINMLVENKKHLHKL